MLIYKHRIVAWSSLHSTIASKYTVFAALSNFLTLMVHAYVTLSQNYRRLVRKLHIPDPNYDVYICTMGSACSPKLNYFF